MRRETFTGTPYEIGVQQGRRYLRAGTPFVSHGTTRAYRRQLAIYEEHFPQFLERCEGIAKGAKADPEAVKRHFVLSPIAALKGQGCTIFGVQSKKGTFVGRNYDWLPVAEREFRVLRFSCRGAHSYTAVSDMYIGSMADVREKTLFYEPDDAINAKGLYIGLTYAYDAHRGYGLSPMHLIELVAQRCASVDDALALFARVPLAVPKNFFLADRKGDLAVVEHTSRRYRVVRPKDGILIQTNDFTDPVLAKEDTVLKVHPSADTYLRYYGALRDILPVKEDFSSAQTLRVLLDARSHILERGRKSRTIWSLVLGMTAREYSLYAHEGAKMRKVSLAPPARKVT